MKTKPAPKKLAPAAPAAGVEHRPDRIDRVMIGGHFSPKVRQELRLICARETLTMQSLLAEAINLVLAKRKRPQIAGAENGK